MGNNQSTHVFKDPDQRFRRDSEIEHDGPVEIRRPDFHRGIRPEMYGKNIKAKRIKATEAPEPSCCICGERYHVEQEIIRLPCGHDVDESCIHEWLADNSCCPICQNFLSVHQLPMPTIGLWRHQIMERRRPLVDLIRLQERPYHDPPAELGPKETRKVVLAALFPQFLEEEEVEERQQSLRDDWDIHSRFIGARMWEPDRGEWKDGIGLWEEIRRAGTATDGVEDGCYAPWKAASVIQSLIQEAPDNFEGHARMIDEAKSLMGQGSWTRRKSSHNSMFG
ncbi:hypothetical protein BT69DRAFT_1275527 [Atractiella rhizophila]|nr:hypothetical protein BT69DRAFT_1275527 [Atractiella rhizophila]